MHSFSDITTSNQVTNLIIGFANNSLNCRNIKGNGNEYNNL